MPKSAWAVWLVMAVLAAVSIPVSAQEPYLDDRSTATAVVRSYYNAIRLGQYSRAWSYRLRTDPSTDWHALNHAYENFRDGFGDHPSQITLLTGPEIEDVAVGTYRYGVPVAIDVPGEDGRGEQFAGCFYLRLSSPSAQEGVPYQPMFIERTHMQRARGRLEQIIPAECDPG